MRVAFDTSVLVAALVAAHPHHARAAIWLDAAATRTVEGYATWHALAETWSVLTRLPLRPQLSPKQAVDVVLRLESVLTLTIPTVTLYRAALRRAAERGIRSGGLFDALHLVAAERSRAEILLTFNGDDFLRVVMPASPRVVEPPDPPSLTP